MTVLASAGRRAVAAPPGQRFGLFSECALVGLVVTVACLPVLTWVTAIAAGARWIDGYVAGRPSGAKVFLADFRALLPGTVAVALAGFAGLTLLALDAALALAVSPGGEVVAAVLLLVMAAVVVVQLRCAATWRYGERWWRQVRQAGLRTVTDPVGSLLLAAALAMVAVTTWQLPPLVVPAVGCLAMAAPAVEHRRAARISGIG